MAVYTTATDKESNNLKRELIKNLGKHLVVILLKVVFGAFKYRVLQYISPIYTFPAFPASRLKERKTQILFHKYFSNFRNICYVYMLKVKFGF